MDINKKSLDTLFLGFKNNFAGGMAMAPDSWQKFAGTVPSGTSGNIYPFLEQFGGMRKWVGNRQIKNIASHSLPVYNDEYEDTVSVKRPHIRDDQYGIYSKHLADLGLNAAKLWNDLAYEALVDSTGKWLDGKAFYATDRKYGKSTICNKCTAALSDTTFNTAYQTMLSYRGHNDRSIGIMPNLLICGPKLRQTAWNIVKNEFTYNGTDKVQIKNMNQNVVELHVALELIGDYDDYWFLAATNGVLKPVMVQQRELPVLTRLDKADDENVFMANEYIYGTNASGASFKSMPHLIYAGIL